MDAPGEGHGGEKAVLTHNTLPTMGVSLRSIACPPMPFKRIPRSGVKLLFHDPIVLRVQATRTGNEDRESFLLARIAPAFHLLFRGSSTVHRHIPCWNRRRLACLSFRFHVFGRLVERGMHEPPHPSFRRAWGWDVSCMGMFIRLESIPVCVQALSHGGGCPSLFLLPTPPLLSSACISLSSEGNWDRSQPSVPPPPRASNRIPAEGALPPP